MENIKVWLEQNRDLVVKENKYLSIEQREIVTDKINSLISSLTDENKETIISDGNNMLEKMNNWIDNTRLEQIPSIETFLNVIYSNPNGETKQDVCSFIMDMFDELLAIKKYDIIIEYLQKIEFDKVKNKSYFYYLEISTNPISPLLRVIPKKENISSYYQERYKLFTNWKNLITDPEISKLIKCDSFDNYDKEVNNYDMLYMFGAPKEN